MRSAGLPSTLPTSSASTCRDFSPPPPASHASSLILFFPTPRILGSSGLRPSGCDGSPSCPALSLRDVHLRIGTQSLCAHRASSSRRGAVRESCARRLQRRRDKRTPGPRGAFRTRPPSWRPRCGPLSGTGPCPPPSCFSQQRTVQHHVQYVVNSLVLTEPHSVNAL